MLLCTPGEPCFQSCKEKQLLIVEFGQTQWYLQQAFRLKKINQYLGMQVNMDNFLSCFRHQKPKKRILEFVISKLDFCLVLVAIIMVDQTHHSCSCDLCGVSQSYFALEMVDASMVSQLHLQVVGLISIAIFNFADCIAIASCNFLVLAAHCTCSVVFAPATCRDHRDRFL